MDTRHYNSFLDAVLTLKNRKELRGFFDALLTPKEREELPKRLEIVKLLKKGVPQHAIAEKLGVGIATVTRGSKELAKGNFSSWR